MTSILKQQPNKADNELIVATKKEKTDSICSTKLSPGSSEKPIQMQQTRFSTKKTISSQPDANIANVKAFQNVTISANLPSQELTKKNFHKDKWTNATYPLGPAVMDLGQATNEMLARGSATQMPGVASISAKANVAPMLAKASVPPILAKTSVAPMLANRFQPIISFAGSLFTADASPEVIDTVMVNDHESYDITRSQDRMKIEPKCSTTNENKQDMFWCGICGNMYEREETLMMHVKTHQIPTS